VKKQEKTAGKLARNREDMKARVADMQKQVEELGFSETEFNAIEQEKNQLEETVSELRSAVDTLSSKIEGRLRFKYSDPVRGFDRSKVKGIVAKLITVHNPVHATALDVVGGGKLYQVVVDEAITGKALLDKGKLERRVVIIPLDKIKSRQLSDAVTRNASSIAKSLNTTSSPAIELVGFDEEVRTAMEYVFGSTLVVEGAKAANQICDQTKTRTVTLEGDVYDPSGTISGGSKSQGASILETLMELHQATREHDEKAAALKTATAKVDSLKDKSIEYDNLTAALDLKKAELAGVEKHLSQTSYGMLVERFEGMSKELEQAQEEFVNMEKEKEDKWNLYNELKNRETELTQQRETRLKEIDDAVKKAKKDAAEKAKLAREAESKSQTLVLELDSLKTELVAAKEAARAAEKVLNDANTEESDRQMKVGEVKAVYDDAKEALTASEKRRASCSTELTRLEKERSNKRRDKEKSIVEIKKLQVAIAKMEKERVTAERVVSSMLNKYSWIESEQSAFGVTGGDYDFGAMNPKEYSKQLQHLKSEQDSLAKKINKKVMGMIEKAEGEYTELLRKRKVVENDKKKIEAVISELDVKKIAELQRTWVKVNRDFGDIFTTLLPGTQAKLEPPEGMEAWEGLEVKVAFGNVWKESLSELSGGQRSLLALSLILSLLLFKPAPM